MDAEKLFDKTAGNPLFVTEVLAAGGPEVPETIRDAVLARAARLGPEARMLLDALSVVSYDLLVDPPPDSLEECLASGMLDSTATTIEFRHELARLAIESALTALAESLFIARRSTYSRTCLRRNATSHVWQITRSRQRMRTPCCASLRQRPSVRRRSEPTAKQSASMRERSDSQRAEQARACRAPRAALV